MLNPQLHADTEKPDAGGAPEVLLDGRTWRDRAGTTDSRGRFGRGTSPLVLFGGRRRGYSTHRDALDRLPI